jgi:LmbE family N-acetylglucosaminyl deacetylase
MRGKPVTEEEKQALRKKHRKRRLWVYGSLLAGLFAAYSWQPWEFDVVPRRLPNPNPPMNPDKEGLFAPGTKVLVITAHPDDSEFYIGGLLTKLGKTADIRQVICTDGDKGYYGPFTNADENRRVRRAEAREANRSWGGKGVEFLSHPDGRLRANDELIDQLAQTMRTFQPDYVLAFDGDFPPRFSHQDHRRAGDAALAAAKKSGVPKWCLLFSTIAPNFAFDITDLWDQKKLLLAVHKSQWTGERLERVSNMVAGFAEQDGEAFDMTLAEAFRCIRIRP